MAPGFKWTDTTERMLLLKFLEQNSAAKLDANAAAKSWPSSALGATTKRGITDRFNLLKSKLKEKTIPNTLGMTSTTTPVTYAGTDDAEDDQSSLATPVSTDRAIPPKLADRQAVKSSPNPISRTRGSSTPAFRAKLLGNRSLVKPTPTTSRTHGTKRKHTDTTSTRGRKRARRDASDEDETEEAEQSMTESSSAPENTDGASEQEGTPTHRSVGSNSTGRRTLPARRSKSAASTPGLCREQQDSGTDGDGDTDGDAAQGSESDGSFHRGKKKTAAREESGIGGETWRRIVKRNHGAQDERGGSWMGSTDVEDGGADDVEDTNEYLGLDMDMETDMGLEAD